jgi:hypothetical protein
MKILKISSAPAGESKPMHTPDAGASEHNVRQDKKE